MVEVPITIACGNYDRTRAIRDGRVKVEGCEVTYLPLYPEEIFFRAFRYQEFDVSELSFSSYIRTVAAGNSAYVGIPAFVSRLFRHSGIYVRADAGIRAPADLKRQARRLAGISNHRRGLDARHAAARIRRAADRDPLAQRRPGGSRAATSARRSSRSRGSTSSPSARSRPSSACCATASSTRCSRRARRHRSCAASRTSSGCSPTRARRSRPTTRRPACSRSCISSASARSWCRNIRGCRRASTRRSARPRRWR